MNLDEIRKNKPDGSTHYSGSVHYPDYYQVVENHVDKIWTGEKWRTPVFDWDDELRSGEIKPLY